MKTLRTLSVLGVALFGIATNCAAGRITYNVNLALDACCGGSTPGSVRGFIMTDGTIGTITNANIVDWSLVVALDGGGTPYSLIGPLEPGFSIFQGGPGAVVNVSGGPNLAATATVLSFDTAAHNHGIFQICEYQCRYTSNLIFSVEDASKEISQYSDIQVAGDYLALIGHNQYPANDGVLTIGVAAAPEPSTWFLGAGGLLSAAFLKRRRKVGTR